MTEMWTSSLRYSLTVILVTCSLFVGSDTLGTQNGLNIGAFSSASANAFADTGASANAFTGVSASANANAGAGLSALNNANAFTGTFRKPGLLLPGDGRKEIRGYDNRGFSYDDANRGIKSYGTPSRDVGGLDNKKGGGRYYNKNGKVFKCKWENDDYWENVETEGDGNECETGEDGDDGQYRPEKYEKDDISDYINEFKKLELELQPPLIYKTKLVNAYSDGETQEFGSTSDFLTNTRYAGRTNNFVTTPKYKLDWNNPFSGTLKPPEFGNAAVEETISSSQSSWNSGTASNSFSSLSKSASDSDISASFDTTLKPITNWSSGSGVAVNAAANAAARAAANAAAKTTANAAAKATASSFSSTRKSETWNKNDGIAIASYSTTAKPAREWNIVIYDSNAGRIPLPHKPGAFLNPGHGTTTKPNWSLDYGTTSVVGTSGKQIPTKADVTPVHIGLTKSKPLNSGISIAAPHAESIIAPLGSYGSQFGTQNANSYAGVYAGASGTSGVASNSYKDASEIGKKETHSFEKSYSGINQANSNTGSALGITSDYNKFGHGNQPLNTPSLSTLNNFGTTKRLYGESSIGTNINSARQDDTFNSAKSRESITGSSLYERSDATKSNTNTRSWLNNGQTGSSTLHDTKTTGPRELVSNIGTGITKSPFSYVTTPVSTTSYSSFSGTRSNNLGQSSFNFGNNGANAANAAGARKSTSAITVGTAFDTHSTPGIAETAPRYGESSVFSEVKSSSGSIRSGYGTVPLSTNAETNAWSKQSKNEGKTTAGSRNSASGNRNWSAASESKILTGTQSAESNPWLVGKQPISGNNPWLNKAVSGGKSTFGTTSDISSAASGSRSAEQSESEGKALTDAQSAGSNPWFSKQPISGNNPWLNKVVSGNKSTFGTTSGISFAASGSRPAEQSDGKTLTGAQSAGSNSGFGKQLVSGSNPWLNKQPASGIKPGEQTGSGSKSWSAQSGGSSSWSGKDSESGSETTSEKDDDAWDAQNSCSRKLKGTTPYPTKIYYPVGIGDGNAPSIANTGFEGGSTSLNDLAKWNPANPFLIGVKGGNPSDTSLWNSRTTTTIRPNPFLDRSWTTPRPSYGTFNGNARPIGQGNPFLENVKRRGENGLGSSSSSGQFASSSASAEASSYANVKGSSEELSSQTNRKKDEFYSSGGNYPVEGIGSTASANAASVINLPGGSPAIPGIGIVPVPFSAGSGESNSAANAYAESHAESFSQASSSSSSASSSSFSSSNSFSASEAENSQNKNWSPPIGGGGPQNPAGPKPWSAPSAQATAFASSSAGNWARNYPIDIKG